jgi:hypothetical protein
MIDTLGVWVSGCLKGGGEGALTTLWQKKEYSSEKIGPDGTIIKKTRWLFVHGPTGLRVAFQGHEALWAEVELSRLLHEHNGILLKTQRELDQAVRRLRALLAEVCDLRPEQPWGLRRIDLVGHARIKPSLLVNAYRDFRLPGIRKEAIYYPNESLLWNGTNHRCRIYDKSLKRSGIRGDLARIEWQLHKHKIAAAFSKRLALDDLRIEDCYQAFRRLCSGFEARPVPRLGGLPHLVAIANEKNWRYNGMRVADCLKLGKTRQAHQRIMRKAAALRLEFLKVDLKAAFPADFQAYEPLDVPITF